MPDPVAAAIVTAFVTVVGWLYSRYREDQTRRLQASTAYIERQLEEFYGPLFSRLHQIMIARDIEEALLLTADGVPRAEVSLDAVKKINQYFEETYYTPLHDEVVGIMRTKLHFLEGGEVPDSFYRYLEHVFQKRAQETLYKKHQVESEYLEGKPFSKEWYLYVKADMLILMDRMSTMTGALRPAGRLRLFSALRTPRPNTRLQATKGRAPVQLPD